MGIFIFILLVVLIAAFGFWDTLAAILGATLMVILMILIVAVMLAMAGYMAYRRSRPGTPDVR